VVETGRFAVNLLAEGNSELALHFAGRGGVTGADKFQNGDWSEAPDAPPLLTSATLTLSCEVVAQMQSGTHQIFIGQVKDLSQGLGAAMLYQQSGFHRLAPL
jgi:flavin reductase (DIM6/NTAB) family NADH-FMN oxidoreductase RutF